MIEVIWGVLKFVLLGLGFGAGFALTLLFVLFWLENK